MKLQVIIGSTRPERVTPRMAKWVADEAKNISDIEVEVVDLADYVMPFLDEARSPQFNPDRQPDGIVKKWLDKIAEADAYVLVTPEYNRSYAAVLKNALDYIDFQFERKPVALAAHGSTGGAQAVSHLRAVMPGLLAVTVPKATFMVGGVTNSLDENGKPTDEVKNNPYGPQVALKAMLADTKWYSDTLAAGRLKT